MGADSGLPDSLVFYQDEVQTELRHIINSNSSSVYGMLRYHLGWEDEGGHPAGKQSSKLIRSTLCLLSCEAVGGCTSKILPAAAAIELIHNFSLIHDDIEDASCERRHRPTVWKLWGQPQAINAGDCMFALAYAALLRLKQNGIADGKILGSIQMLAETCLELCEGQYLDIAYEDRFDISIDDYLEMIEKKTAALLAASTYLGGYLGTEDEEMVSHLYRFGRQLGLAYQIRDDILGIWGTEQSTGKPVGGDILQRKKSLPVVYGLQNSNPEDRGKLARLYSQQHIQGENVPEVIRILEQSVARDYAQRLAENCYSRALAELDLCRLELSRQAQLREVARFLIERDY